MDLPVDSMSFSHTPISDHEPSETKRRKLRKGTHSCWECKRRKMRCIVDPSANSATCNGCQRRGSQCISQEFPPEVSIPMPMDERPNTDDVSGIETTTPSNDRHTSIVSESTPYLSFFKSFQHPRVEDVLTQSTPRVSASQGKYETLSRFLHAALPSREDTEKICKASSHSSVLAHEIMTIPYKSLEQYGLKTTSCLAETPEPTAHPVLIAKHMLLLAIFIQNLHPDLRKEIKGLAESPHAIMERLADLAASLVTTNDQLLGSIEGLECIMIESVYQTNIGNLRRSWVSGRRAMSVAQLMGLNRSDAQAQFKVLDPNKECDPQLMWFRIVFLDRYLCLMLGVSQGCLDLSMASETILATDTPMGRLERLHCVIASRILERNESNPSSRDSTLTQTLDLELQKAARSLPSKWWLVPNLDSSIDSQALFWNTRQMFAQVLHYSLLNQLHLPYMLRSTSTEHSDEYSRITCVNASRELLSRFISLRSFNGIAYSCRTVDFLALMAAMTLLLAHLDSSLVKTKNLLAHQYHSDRAMIERVQENMEEVNRLNSDALSAQSADLLRRLLYIQVEIADAGLSSSRRVSVEQAGTQTAVSDDDIVVSVYIPYFGVIKIAREGVSKQTHPEPQPHVSKYRITRSQSVDGSQSRAPQAEPRIHSSDLPKSSGISATGIITPVESGYTHAEEALMSSYRGWDTCAKTHAQIGQLPVPSPNTNNFSMENNLADTMWQDGDLPDLAAVGEDWAFQGVDMAFFDSLMRSDVSEGAENADGTVAPDLKAPPFTGNHNT